MHPKTRFSLILSLLVMGMAGCSSYSPVVPAQRPVRIAVAPIVNESDLPQIIAPLARNIREKLAHSPNWELVDEEIAEAKLRLTVLPLVRRSMARDPRDTGRPLSFYEEIRLSVEWASELPAPWGPDNVIEVSGDQILYAQPSLTDARVSATAGMAERLAEKILQRLDWATPAAGE